MFRFIILKDQQIIMKYTLNTTTQIGERKKGVVSVIKSLWPLLLTEKRRLILALLAILINSGFTLIAPILIGHVIDTYIISKNFHGVIVFSVILFVIYIGGLISGYLQTTLMGTVGQRALYNIRNKLFDKIQSLPIAFFNANKAGDLISRINNDTDKLNQFLSQSLVQFVGSVFVMIGAGIFLLALNLKLGLLALAPAVFILIFTRIVSPWVRKVNSLNLKSVGSLSSEIQESIENFKVVVAFNRRDYFRSRFSSVNDQNYDSAIKSGIANNIFAPVYGLASNIAQVLVLAFGVYYISSGHFTIGLLISFLSYTTNFYNPLRQIATVWASFQVAMAGWDRISDILAMENDLSLVESTNLTEYKDSVLAFDKVSFAYTEDKNILNDVNFSLLPGKTYALVGPTGGGKTTTASLMARLYDPNLGTIFLSGKDIRSYSDEERTQKIGFILQEPFLFSGSLKENILYGNSFYKDYNLEQTNNLIKESGLDELINSFDKGLETSIKTNSDSISLGQKQIIAFIRAVLRSPDILILDEATANIDTMTEVLLQNILDKLPRHTTRVIIAHRLHTIEKADEIFFVNNSGVVNAGSMEQAVEMLLHSDKKS